MTKRLGIEKKKKKKDKIKKQVEKQVEEGTWEGATEGLQNMKEKEVWVIEDFEEPYYVTPESEDFKRMKKEPKDIGAFAGGGRVIKYFNRGGGVYGYNQGGGVNKHQGQYDIQVKKIKGKGKVL